jgi:hypothetical protein
MSLATLVVPTGTLPKFSAGGAIAVGVAPVALNATERGLFDALADIVSVPAGTAPKAVGVTVIDMAQVTPEASELPHVLLEIAYTEGDTATLLMVNGASS